MFLPLFFATLQTFSFLPSIPLTEASSGIDGIDCIYVINLDKNIDRWEYMQSTLHEQGLHGNRVSAIYGKKLKQSLIDTVLSSLHYPLRPAQVGCFLSHISVWKDAFYRDFDRIWVMEDDVLFEQSSSLINPILSILSDLDPEWDIFYTDYREATDHLHLARLFQKPDLSEALNHFSDYGKGVDIHKDPDLKRTFSRWGAYSMIISKRGIKKLFNHIIITKILLPIDDQIHFIPNLRQYMPKRTIASVNRSFVSDIARVK